jgi:hypothetical protein
VEALFGDVPAVPARDVPPAQGGETLADAPSDLGALHPLVHRLITEISTMTVQLTRIANALEAATTSDGNPTDRQPPTG